MKVENEREKELRQRLEAVLEPNEELLAYAKGTVSGFLSSRSVYIGLTAERLVLVPLEYGKPSKVLTIWREGISSVKWSVWRDSLRVQLLKDTVGISGAGGDWKRRIRELADLHNQLPIPDQDTTPVLQKRLQQIETYRELGFIVSAQAVIEELKLDVIPEASPERVSLEEIDEKRLALRVGTGFLLVNVVLALLLAVIILMGGGVVNPGLVVSIIIDTGIPSTFARAMSKNPVSFHKWKTPGCNGGCPMKPALYLIPALVVAVSFLIRARFLERRCQTYVLKPASTLMVTAVALASFLEPTRNLIYTIGVSLGLLFSLGGDVALMFEDSRKAFPVGLGSFLVAHIIYTVVFLSLGRFSAWDIFSTVVLLVAGAGFYRLAEPNLGSMKGPVIGYILVISVMVSRALSTLVSPVFSDGQASMVVIGALLFYFSDVILGANRFWRPWKYHSASLALYYGGQSLIALAASYFV